MTAEDFRAWMQRSGLSQEQAGALVCATQGEVSRWVQGKRPVPARVALIIHLREELRTVQGMVAVGARS